ETYDRKLDDIFKIQDEIAGEVVKQLKVTLLGAAPKTRTTSPQSYALYLQAVQLERQLTAEALAKSDELLRRALAIDPGFAPAWGELAGNHYHEIQVGARSQEDGYARARDEATKALAVDPDYAPAHAWLGRIAMERDNDLAGAAPQFERALTLRPADLDGLRPTRPLATRVGRGTERRP